MNQLQAVALNEGLRCKKKLSREHGREQLESFRLAPWASRRREDLLQLLDRLSPTIAELTEAVEREAEKSPQARQLMTHPGVGALTSLAFVLIIGKAERFQCGKQISAYRFLHRRFDCFRLERPSSRTGLSPAVVQRLFTAHVRYGFIHN